MTPTIKISFSENTEVTDATEGRVFTSFAAVDAVLRAAALRLDAEDRCYDKTDFSCELDGDTYTGRVDLQHPANVSGNGFRGLVEHMAEHAGWVAENGRTEVEQLKGKIWALRVRMAALIEARG